MFKAFGKNLMSDDFLGNAKEIQIKELTVGTETYYLPIRDFADEGQLVVEITLSEPAKTMEIDADQSIGSEEFIDSSYMR